MTICTGLHFMFHLFDSTDGWDVVALCAPLVVAVVFPPLGHVPQVLTAPEVLMFVTDPSGEESTVEGSARKKSGWIHKQRWLCRVNQSSTDIYHLAI